VPYSAGTFTFTSNSFAPTPTSGTTISSTSATSTWTELATGLSTCLLKDGTQTVTANIPMSSFIFTGLGAGTAAGHSLRYEQIFAAGAALTAAGTGQSDALQLAAPVNQVTTVAANTGVKLYASPNAGQPVVVYNGGANPLKVYPQTSGTINNLSANTGITLATNTACMFFAASSTAWVAVLSA
jgi:hypothetical protein